MAKRSGAGQLLCIGGYDLSGDIGVIRNAASPRDVQDVTGLNKTSVERILLRGNGILEHNVWFNDASAQAFPVLKALPTADTHAIWGISNTLGDPAAGLVAKQVNFDWQKRADGSVEGAVQALGQGSPLEWCKMLTAGVDTHVGATNGSSVDDVASSAYGLIGYIQVLAFSGTDLTIVIQESSDNGGADPWATKLAFTQVTAARKFERKTATGTVERYLRAITTTAGGFASADILVVYRRGTVQDDETL